MPVRHKANRACAQHNWQKGKGNFKMSIIALCWEELIPIWQANGTNSAQIKSAQTITASLAAGLERSQLGHQLEGNNKTLWAQSTSETMLNLSLNPTKARQADLKAKMFWREIYLSSNKIIFTNLPKLNLFQFGSVCPMQRASREVQHNQVGTQNVTRRREQ